MKKIISVFIFCILQIFLFAQKTSVEQILTLEEVKMPIYEPQSLAEEQLYLNMPYGSSFISNSKDIEILNNAIILSIDIVCSDHPVGNNFKTLTRNRILKLKKILPKVFDNEQIKWQLVRQTNCTDKASAKRLFHGIVITYRIEQSAETVKKEIKYIEDLFKKSDITIAESSTTSRSFTIKKEFRDGILIESDTTGDYFDVDFGGDFGDEDWSIEGDSSGFSSYSIDFYTSSIKQDSTVFKVFDRNNWQKMLVVGDVTGSMSPYIGQLLIWLKLNTLENRFKHFVFFNDGDMTPDNEKIIGKTGGIYGEATSDYEKVQTLVMETMKKGYGGDGPENDVEALLKAIKDCPDCDNVVLVADNWAPIKDISLMKQIDKPIKIILCGAHFGINTEYLDLARQTGGSVHTMEDDLTELMDLHEGELLTINKQTFTIRNGRFIKISKM